jgi:predicted DNA binding protein
MDVWLFQIRFPSHDRLAEFQTLCFEADIPLDIKRTYNPTRPDAGPWYGLTTPQRETLIYAVENGYYSLPRQSSTREIAEHFDVSDQAITERLRRAIETLVTNTLLLTVDDESD